MICRRLICRRIHHRKLSSDSKNSQSMNENAQELAVLEKKNKVMHYFNFGEGVSAPREKFIRNIAASLHEKTRSAKVQQHGNKLRQAYNEIRRKLQYVHPSSKVCCIGSLPTHSVVLQSDLDLIFAPHSDKQSLHEQFMRDFQSKLSFRKMNLSSLHNHLRRTNFVQSAEILWHARVPLIKGRTRSGISFDIQIGNTECIHSTNFIRIAHLLDERVMLLSTWLRIFLESLHLFGGRSGMFSTFHLRMLTVFYAQQIGLIPHLMSAYHEELRPERPWQQVEMDLHTDVQPLVLADFASESVIQSIGDLVLDMIGFYSVTDFTENILDVGANESRQKKTNKLLLVEPYFNNQAGICRVSNGATLMKKAFLLAREAVEREKWDLIGLNESKGRGIAADGGLSLFGRRVRRKCMLNYAKISVRNELLHKKTDDESEPGINALTKFGLV